MSPMSLEWFFFGGILGFLTFQIILKSIWENVKREIEGVAMWMKPPSISDEQKPEEEVDELSVCSEDSEFESMLHENFCEESDIKEPLSNKVSKEENNEDTTSGLTAERFLTDEVKYKLAYFFRDLSIMESQSEVPDEPTACEYETSDEAFEGIADEQQCGKDENGDLEGGPCKNQDHQDKESPEAYFPEEHSCKA